MTTLAPLLAQQFAGRLPGLGTAYVLKDRLSLTDSGSKLLGVDEGKMCSTHVITSDDPDRVDDVVVTKGIYLVNFKTNPIAFFGHQVFPLPIGKWATRDGDKCTIRLKDHEAIGTCYYSQRTKEAEQVFALVAEGILRATSIGFNPMDEPEPRDGRKSNPISLQRGYVFPKVDLLEVSIVGIPAQPTATLVRECLSRNKLAGGAILAPIRKSLEAIAEPQPAWSNGATLESPDMSKKWGKTVPKAKAAPVPATPPPAPKADDTDLKAICLRLETLTEHVLKATAVQKQPPPPKSGEYQPPDADMPGDGAGEQNQDGPPEPGHGKADPKDVLNRLVDALTDYIDLTTKPAPTQAAPEMEEEEEDDGEGLDQEEAANGEDDEEEVGDERYQFRDVKPQHAKAMTLCKACMKGLCATCKAAMAEGEGSTGGDTVPDEMPEEVKAYATDDDGIDEQAILSALRPCSDRTRALANAWESLQGKMP